MDGKFEHKQLIYSHLSNRRWVHISYLGILILVSELLVSALQIILSAIDMLWTVLRLGMSYSKLVKSGFSLLSCT